MTESQAKALVATLAAAFPNQRISQATLNVYALDLADLDFVLAQKAVETVRRGAKFMPTIAEIRTVAADLRLGAPSPMVAFDQASTKPLEERHALVQRAKRMVGDSFDWRESPRGVLRKAFLVAYDEVKSASMAELVTPAVAQAQVHAIESHRLELEAGV